MYKILSSSPCNSRLEWAPPRLNCSSPLCYLSAMRSSKSQLNLSELSLCAHLDCSLEACVLRWLLPLDPRGTEWPAKIKTWFSTPLIESHTPWFLTHLHKLIVKPKASLSNHSETSGFILPPLELVNLEWLRLVWGVFEHILVFLAFPTTCQDLTFHRWGWSARSTSQLLCQHMLQCWNTCSLSRGSYSPITLRPGNLHAISTGLALMACQM